MEGIFKYLNENKEVEEMDISEAPTLQETALFILESTEAVEANFRELDLMEAARLITGEEIQEKAGTGKFLSKKTLNDVKRRSLPYINAMGALSTELLTVYRKNKDVIEKEDLKLSVILSAIVTINPYDALVGKTDPDITPLISPKSINKIVKKAQDIMKDGNKKDVDIEKKEKALEKFTEEIQEITNEVFGTKDVPIFTAYSKFRKKTDWKTKFKLVKKWDFDSTEKLFSSLDVVDDFSKEVKAILKAITPIIDIWEEDTSKEFDKKITKPLQRMLNQYIRTILIMVNHVIGLQYTRLQNAIMVIDHFNTVSSMKIKKIKMLKKLRNIF